MARNQVYYYILINLYIIIIVLYKVCKITIFVIGYYFQYYDTNTRKPAYNDDTTGLGKLDSVVASASAKGISKIFNILFIYCFYFIN